MNNIFTTMWEFIRGDLPSAHFEELLYKNANNEYEKYLGHSLYFECIENSYDNRDTTFLLKQKLKAFQQLNHPSKCKCIEIPNTIHIVDIWMENDGTLDTYERVASRWYPYWWLNLSKCNICWQYALIAQEERHNDIFCVLKLSDNQTDRILTENTWPTELDSYFQLLKLGFESWRHMSHVDPYSWTLQAIIEDIMSEGIPIDIEELAKFLGVSTSFVREIMNVDSK